MSEIFARYFLLPPGPQQVHHDAIRGGVIGNDETTRYATVLGSMRGTKMTMTAITTGFLCWIGDAGDAERVHEFFGEPLFCILLFRSIADSVGFGVSLYTVWLRLA